LKIRERSPRESLGSYLQEERVDAWGIDDFSKRKKPRALKRALSQTEEGEGGAGKHEGNRSSS